jgi:pimeloyl-ACP methyl ester carboxylesterase
MAYFRNGALTLSYLQLGHRRAAGSEPVVLVHGLASSLAFWFLRVGHVLAAERRVLMYDLRGHGRSSMPSSGYTPDCLAADLRGLLDELRIERAHLIGHSFGGTVALRFALDYPEQVSTVTLADTRLRSFQPTIDTKRWESWPRYRSMFERIGIDLGDQGGDFGIDLFERLAHLRLENRDALEQLQRFVPIPFRGPRGDNQARRWLELLETTSARSDISKSEDFDEKRLGAFEKPLLLVYGERSQALPTGRALSELCPCTSFTQIPRGGHFFPISMPGKLIDTFNDFLQAPPGKSKMKAAV